MAHDVFVSYSKLDKAKADAVCATLESHGIRCWIAPRDVMPGTDWGEAIVKAIGSCRVMVLVFSSHANESPQVRREVQRAFERGLTVIPLRVEEVAPVESLEYYIGPVHWLDALTPPLERHLQSLASQAQRLLESNAQNPEPDRHRPPRARPKVSVPPRRKSSTRYGPARFLQLFGLIILAFALCSEMTGRVALGQSLIMAAGGAGLFYTGYALKSRS
jgi:hypothetical protein